MREGVRYQMYESADGHVLFMASEQAFWKNFCDGRRPPRAVREMAWLEVRRPRARQPRAQAELRDIFKTRTTDEWIAFGNEVNTPMAPVNTSKTIADDPQFQDRFPWIPASRLGADEMPLPLRVAGEELPVPTHAPTVGQHTDEVLAEVLGYDAARVAALREAGALG